MKESKLKMSKDFCIDPTYKNIYLLGGLSCIIFMLYSLATILIMTILGGPPQTISECFNMLSENKLFGLLRLDILTVFVMPLYYILFYSLYTALKKVNKEIIIISTLLLFVGLTLFLAAPSVFSYLDLRDRFAAATTETQKSQLLSAGEAIIASDIWHGTGARIGGMLMQIGAFIISITMLKSNVFSKVTAIVGIFTHGLDLLHIILGFFNFVFGIVLMSIAGILYLLWFPLVGIRLFDLCKYCRKEI